MKKRVLLITLAFVLMAWPAAFGEYRGTDILGNVSPASQTGGGLVDRYPLSAYSLDYYVDVGVMNPDGIPPMIAQWAAAQTWNATSFLIKTTIDLFTWAFSLDLLGGADGALAPISDAISSLYQNVIGQSWMVAAIVIAGIWGIWKALVQRRYTETAGAFGISVVFVLIALFFVYQPERTIGQASSWTNTLSLAFLSGANRGSLDDPAEAKRSVSDHLFETLVVKPWAVLEFGGLSHCVDTDRLDDDGFPRPVSPHDASADVCRNHLRPGRDGHGGYAPRFLRQAPGSDERKAEYDALREGELPEGDPQFRGYRVDKADAPAVDAQQAGGAFQRLTLSIVIFLGSLGAVVLLGFLSLAVILAQIVALVLLGFAPVALVIGIFPGAGHTFFRGWLAKLATAIFIKALYSLVIAIVVAVSAALTAATDSLGFLFAFGLQTIFFWAIFLYRKQLTRPLVAATTGAAAGAAAPKMTMMQKGAHAAARPFSALASVTRGGWPSKQETALAGVGAAGAAAGAAAGVAAANGHGSAGGGADGNGGSGGRNGTGLMDSIGVKRRGESPNGAADGEPPVSPNGDRRGFADQDGNGHVAGLEPDAANGHGQVPVENAAGQHAATVRRYDGDGYGSPPDGRGSAGLGTSGGPRSPADGGRSAGNGGGGGGWHPDRPAGNGHGSGWSGDGASGSGGHWSDAAPAHGSQVTPGDPLGHGPMPRPEPAGPEPTPRASHEDVMRRARELRQRERDIFDA